MTTIGRGPIEDRHFRKDGVGDYHDQTVTYITRLCTAFKITRLREGVYIAENRTEFLRGTRTYRSLESMNADLANR